MVRTCLDLGFLFILFSSCFNSPKRPPGYQKLPEVCGDSNLKTKARHLYSNHQQLRGITTIIWHCGSELKVKPAGPHTHTLSSFLQWVQVKLWMELMAVTRKHESSWTTDRSKNKHTEVLPLWRILLLLVRHKTAALPHQGFGGCWAQAAFRASWPPGSWFLLAGYLCHATVTPFGPAFSFMWWSLNWYLCCKRDEKSLILYFKLIWGSSKRTGPQTLFSLNYIF